MKLTAAAIAALALALSTAARAEIVQITYTGYVKADSTPDSMGLFGAPGASLAGDTYTAVYTINDAQGMSATDGSTFSVVAGSGATPAVTEVLTISGVSFDEMLGTASFGEQVRVYGHVFPIPVFGGLTGPIYGLYSIVNGAHDLSSGNGIVSNNPITSSYDYHQPMTYITQSTDTSLGTFQDCSSSGPSCDGLELYSATVQVIDVVPEPAAWALMLAGFGAVGAALRAKSGRRARA